MSGSENGKAAPGRYVQVVGVAMGILMDLYQSSEEVGEEQLERAAGMARRLNRDVIDDEKMEWLRRDLRLLVRTFWSALRDRRNRGRFDEIIWSALR